MTSGVYVPNITFFTKEGDVDLKKTQAHMRWMIEKGVDGFFLTGSYGSNLLLSVDEKIRIYQIAAKLKEMYPSLQLIAHIYCPNMHDTIACALQARRVGVNSIASIPPIYYQFTKKDIMCYYETLIKSTGCEVYAYNNPKTTGVKMNYDMVVALQEIGLKGIKDSSLDVDFLSTLKFLRSNKENDFDIIIGSSTGWLAYYALGFRTMISGMCNYAPEIIVEMYKACLEEDHGQAEMHYTRMLQLNRSMKKADSVITSMLALKARGFPDVYPRQPLSLYQHNDHLFKEIICELQKVGISLNDPFEEFF